MKKKKMGAHRRQGARDPGAPRASTSPASIQSRANICPHRIFQNLAGVFVKTNRKSTPRRGKPSVDPNPQILKSET